MDRSYDDEDELKAEMSAGGVFKEFDCPSCNAHNPYDDGFTIDSEVLCFYCGTEFKVKLSDGKVKLKET